MTTKEIFESIGFDGEYRINTEEFYYKYFNSETDMHQFIIEVLKNDDEDNTHRRMINQVRRFVEMANASDNIDHGVDSLKILFLCCCLESLSKLSSCKKTDFYKKLAECFNEEDKEYILSSFIFMDVYTQPKGTQSSFENCNKVYNLTIDDFLNVMRQARNSAVHEGKYWEMQFFSNKSDVHLCVSMQTNEKMLPDDCYSPKKGENVVYAFTTTMLYERFIGCFVRCCVNYIMKYVRGKEAELNNG